MQHEVWSRSSKEQTLPNATKQSHPRLVNHQGDHVILAVCPRIPLPFYRFLSCVSDPGTHVWRCAKSLGASRIIKYYVYRVASITLRTNCDKTKCASEKPRSSRVTQYLLISPPVLIINVNTSSVKLNYSNIIRTLINFIQDELYTLFFAIHPASRRSRKTVPGNQPQPRSRCKYSLGNHPVVIPRPKSCDISQRWHGEQYSNYTPVRGRIELGFKLHISRRRHAEM